MSATVTVHSPSYLGVVGPAIGAPFVAGDAKTAGALACGWSGATLDERGGCPASRVRYEVVVELPKELCGFGLGSNLHKLNTYLYTCTSC